jgi:hypothetical protein
LTRSLEHIAAVDFHAAQIAGLARHAAQIFEPIVIGFKIIALAQLFTGTRFKI